MKNVNSTIADYLEIKRLEQRANRVFEDTYATAQRRLKLYQKYLVLRKTHKVRFAGRFLVIDGGRNEGAADYSGVLIY